MTKEQIEKLERQYNFYSYNREFWTHGGMEENSREYRSFMYALDMAVDAFGYEFKQEGTDKSDCVIYPSYRLVKKM